MSDPARREGRTVLVPTLINPYEGDIRKGETTGNNTYGNGTSANAVPQMPPPPRQSFRGHEEADKLTSSQLPPPLPPPPVVLASTRSHVSEDIDNREETLQLRAGNTALIQPPRRVPAGASKQQTTTPLRVPERRGPNSVPLVLHMEADIVSVSTNDMRTGVTSMGRSTSGNNTQRPFSAPSARYARNTSVHLQQPKSEYTKKTQGDNAVSFVCDRSGAFKSSEQQSPSPRVEHILPTPTPIQPPLPPPPRVEEEQPPPAQPYGFVMQSDFTEKNPFRSQTFEAFCCSPDYSAPPDCQTDNKDINAWREFSRATEGGFRDQCVMGNSPHRYPSSSALLKNSVSPESLRMLQGGDWFYKWTRHGSVHERYVWLDLQREAFLWGPGPRPAVIFISQLPLGYVLDLRPDCMFDETTKRTFYRIFIVAEGRTIVFATEVRDKFDMWFDALNKITVAYSNIHRRGAPNVSTDMFLRGKWATRDSPLQAVLRGQGTSAFIAANRSLIRDRSGRVLPSD